MIEGFLKKIGEIGQALPKNISDLLLRHFRPENNGDVLMC